MIKFGELLLERCHKRNDHQWDVLNKSGNKVASVSTSNACKQMSRSINGKKKTSKAVKKKVKKAKKVVKENFYNSWLESEHEEIEKSAKRHFIEDFYGGNISVSIPSLTAMIEHETNSKELTERAMQYINAYFHQTKKVYYTDDLIRFFENDLPEELSPLEGFSEEALQEFLWEEHEEDYVHEETEETWNSRFHTL